MVQPVAGQTHDLVLRYGAPGAYKYQGLMLPSKSSMTQQPYTPFAPASRQGNATLKDFNITSVWELATDWSGGTGRILVGDVEGRSYAYAEGADMVYDDQDQTKSYISATYRPKTGPCLTTHRRGVLKMPPLNVVAAIESAGEALTVNTVTETGSAPAIAWTNPSNARVEDGNLATVTMDGTNVSKTLRYTLSSPTPSAVYHALSVILKCKKAGTGSPTITVKITGNSDTRVLTPTTTLEYRYIKLVPYPYYDRNPIIEITVTGGNNGDVVSIDSLACTGYLSSYFNQTLVFNGAMVAFVPVTNSGYVMKYVNGAWTTSFSCTATGKQIYTDGSTLYVTQGSGTFVKKTTDMTTWTDDTIKVDYMVIRSDGTRCTATGNTFNPGGTYASRTVGSSSSNIKNLIFADGLVYIVKNEGLWAWNEQDDTLVKKVDCQDAAHSFNFRVCFYHAGALYYNILARLFVVINNKTMEIRPADLGAFQSIDCGFGMQGGPAFFGIRMQRTSYLMMFPGPGDPALIPMWSTEGAVGYLSGIGSWIDPSTVNSVPYFHIVMSGPNVPANYIAMWGDWSPATIIYHERPVTVAPHIILSPHDAGFPAIRKWYYELVASVRTLAPTVKMKLWYSTDRGTTWSQITDHTGVAKEFTLNDYYLGGYFPLNTVTDQLLIKIEMYGDDNNSNLIAELESLTLRGDVMVNRRDLIACTIQGGETVQGLTASVQDTGASIRAALLEASTQGYPCAVQDARGNWYLVLIKPPTPMETVTAEVTTNNARIYPAMYQVQFAVVDKLDSSGNLLPWQPG